MRFQFLDPDPARSFWGAKADRVAHDAVAILRAEAGHNPYDTRLTELVGELSTRSEDFSRLWASHDVRYHRSSTKVFHHPAVGDLELDCEALILPAVLGCHHARRQAGHVDSRPSRRSALTRAPIDS